jgi:molybdopterin-guanine dinucleotide biosynthesis protein A
VYSDDVNWSDTSGGSGRVSDSDSADPSAYTGIILAGGSSARLGQNKALVRVAGRSLIERVIDVLYSLVSDVVLVTRGCSLAETELLAYLGLPIVADAYSGVGTLGGLHAGLSAIDSEYGLVVGCDMPLINADLLRYMISQSRGYDVVMPRVGKYHEPLHALYARRCVPALERSILAGQRRILHALAELRIRYIEEAELDRYDPDRLSFFNVNTPEDLERARSLLAL